MGSLNTNDVFVTPNKFICALSGPFRSKSPTHHGATTSEGNYRNRILANYSYLSKHIGLNFVLRIVVLFVSPYAFPSV